jgi:PDZ domain-containing secreted protein
MALRSCPHVIFEFSQFPFTNVVNRYNYQVVYSGPGQSLDSRVVLHVSYTIHDMLSSTTVQTNPLYITKYLYVVLQYYRSEYSYADN